MALITVSANTGLLAYVSHNPWRTLAYLPGGKTLDRPPR